MAAGSASSSVSARQARSKSPRCRLSSALCAEAGGIAAESRPEPVRLGLHLDRVMVLMSAFLDLLR